MQIEDNGGGVSDGEDVLLKIRIAPHNFFHREGNNVVVEVPISVAEAILGAKVDVPTPTGPVTMTVPKGASSGRVLRLKGKGVPRANGRGGDEYVKLKVVLPEKPDPELESFVAEWRAGKVHNPRRAMEA